MTVSYGYEVATCKGLGCFPKLVLRWRASIYKILWLDMIVYLMFYYALMYTYLYALTPEQKKYCAVFVVFCRKSSTLIPLIFVLGFYVSIVVSRWWNQCMSLPWPDPVAVYVTASITGRDDRGRLMRRTIMRYVCLSLTIVLTMIAPRVKRRFPTMEYIRDAGLLSDNEMYILKRMEEKFNQQKNYWMPIVWATSIATRARHENRIRDDASLKSVVDVINNFRSSLMRLLCYDMISIPLVYTQVVTIAVYTFFSAALFGHIYIEEISDITHVIHITVPFIAILEFLFFMGWLKVAESLISPFGDDDDDFELNWVIDRNLTVSYLIVDEMHNEYPELVKDQYWDDILPNKLPRSTTDFNRLKEMNLSGAFTSSLKKLIGKAGSRVTYNMPWLAESINEGEGEGEGEGVEGEGEDDENVIGVGSKSTMWSKFDSIDDFEMLKRTRDKERQYRQRVSFNLSKAKLEDGADQSESSSSKTND